MFKELGWFFKREWAKYILVGFFTIIYTYTVTLPPKYIGIIVDSLFPRNTLTQERALEISLIMLGVGFAIYLSAMLKSRFLGGLYHKLFYQIKYRFMAAGLSNKTSAEHSK
jgi:ABC-type multidrug transport system fused ATPase/permease subunit